MSWRIRAFVLLLCILSVAAGHSLYAGRAPKRPRIWQIAQITALTTDMPGALIFYEKLLPAGHMACRLCAKIPNNALLVNATQSIYLSNAPSPAPDDLIAIVAFATNDLRELRRYLLAQRIEVSPAPKKGKETVLSVLDPEKHRILFIEQPTDAQGVDESALEATKTKGLHIIHAGFIVRDRAATEHFYKDILGFRPYWRGGMKDDGKDDWVSMQVPDGTDWLEFMVNVDANPDQRLRGIMNHIAIGVADIHETEKRLRAAGAPVNEPPKIGRDGKWQLNLYDPDLTRIEFMEFKPVQKPCCSEFTGPHPEPPR